MTKQFTVVILTDSREETSDIYVDSRDEGWYDGAVFRQHTTLRPSWSDERAMRYKRGDLPARQT